MAVAVQRDGKIVAAGLSQKGGIDGPRDLALVRYRSNGQLDTRFGAGGKVMTPVSSVARPQALAVLANGKLIAGGATLVRYAPNGRVDRTFGNQGRAVNGFAQTFAVQRDGKIVVAGGSSFRRLRARRYTRSGRLDPTFGR